LGRGVADTGKDKIFFVLTINSRLRYIALNYCILAHLKLLLNGRERLCEKFDLETFW